MFYRKIVLSFLIFLLSTFISITWALENEETDLKIKDLQNQNLSGINSVNNSNQSISAEQAEDLQKQISTLKEKQLEATKALEELDTE
jgi:ABC-type antimicrobial peptide transport system permease subunit